MFLGVPFNIASYALLLSMVAQVTNLTPHECVLTLGDAHIYHDHLKQVETQLSRTPFKKPTLWLNPDITDINAFTMDDIKLENYEHHEPIKAPMAV
jgi:thymidylate synthase